MTKPAVSMQRCRMLSLQKYGPAWCIAYTKHNTACLASSRCTAGLPKALLLIPRAISTSKVAFIVLLLTFQSTMVSWYHQAVSCKARGPCVSKGCVC